MNIIPEILIFVVIFIHVAIFCFEMFAWERIGPKVIKGFTSEFFTETKTLAANQGLYNGFIVAGLVWSLLITDLTWDTQVATFFLVCVAVAGVFGALTSGGKILFVQTLPALAALAAVYFF